MTTPPPAVRDCSQRWSTLNGLATRLTQLVEANRYVDQQTRMVDVHKSATTITMQIDQLASAVAKECDALTVDVLRAEHEARLRQDKGTR